MSAQIRSGVQAATRRWVSALEIETVAEAVREMRIKSAPAGTVATIGMASPTGCELLRKELLDYLVERHHA